MITKVAGKSLMEKIRLGPYQLFPKKLVLKNSRKEGGSGLNLHLEKFDEQLNEIIDFRITNIGKAIRLIIPEYNQAILKNPPFSSAHEGWAILQQAVDELWDETKRNKAERSPEGMRKEAIIVVATAMRFLIDLCIEENPNLASGLGNTSFNSVAASSHKD